jgi:catechol-2,3-dioxygenase
MPIQKLDHVNVRTAQLETMAAWYTKFLGLSRGDRPNFSSQGAWMYAGDTAVVHLVAVNGSPGTGSEAELKLEHFAFSATDKDAFEAKLNDAGEEYRANPIPQINLVQFNIWDPDGNHIHVDFPMEE